MENVSIERYVRAAHATGSSAKCCCIFRFRRALSSAAMIIEWSSTKIRWPTEPVTEESAVDDADASSDDPEKD